jgi:hypothetical protein
MSCKRRAQSLLFTIINAAGYIKGVVYFHMTSCKNGSEIISILLVSIPAFAAPNEGFFENLTSLFDPIYSTMIGANGFCMPS